MLAEAASDPAPSPLRVAMAAAPAIDSCNIKVRTKTDDEATTSGCISSQLGIFSAGVTAIFDSRSDKSESPDSSRISICCVVLDTSQFVVECRPGWLLPSFPSTEGIMPAKINNSDTAHIHSVVVVAMAAPLGPIRSHQIKTTSREILTRFEPSNITKVVLVSKYPLKIPVEAELTNTAGAAIARTPRKDNAYERAAIPVFPIPIAFNKGSEKPTKTPERVIPRSIARLSACPPISIAPRSSPAARRCETSGVVTVHRKLKR
mmetsp:Transcript_3768/g.10724  ORF Transcript_3768/g.10724 Transcript_3768/m.10724 type:complete len:262 (-) Transcript_3768:259-1044(-)